MRWGFIRKHLDNWLNKGFWIKFITVIAGAVIIFVLAALIVSGISKYLGCSCVPYTDVDVDNQHPLWWQLYYYFADPGNQMSGMGGSRFVGFLFSTLGSIFLSGILISTITNSFERMSESWRAGFSYYKLKNHIVIIGSDQMIYGLVNQLCNHPDKANKTIVIMTSTNVEQMRNALWASLKSKDFRKRIVVNYGQRDSEIFLQKINVAYASEVYLLGDTSEFDKIENYHDSLNVQCLTLISKLRKAVALEGKLKCHVLFDYKTTHHIFQYADLQPEITKYIDFHPFNFYDSWARKVLVVGSSEDGKISYKPLDYIPITSKDSERFVHFIVIGMSQMGQAMALQAAHIAHFPNYRKAKTKITFIDANCKVEMNEFKQKCGELFKVSHSTFIDADAWLEAELNGVDGKDAKYEERFTTEYHLADEYKHLVAEDDADKDFIDVEWEFIKGYDHNPVVQRLLNRYIAEENAIITVAVCLNITHMSLRSAMTLPKKYYEPKKMDGKDIWIPILVQQRKTSSLVSILNGDGFDDDYRQNRLYKSVLPFGMVTECYDLNMVSSMDICKRISYVYDYFFAYDNLATHIDTAKANQIWENTVISKRWSNIFAAASMPTKLRCIGVNWTVKNPCRLDDLTDKQVALLAEVEHNRWNMEELLLGYRPVHRDEDAEIDADKKQKGVYKKRFIHYDIRPFSELKTDYSGRRANEYDEIIVRSLALILNDINK